jgi:hypothetical protein
LPVHYSQSAEFGLQGLPDVIANLGLNLNCRLRDRTDVADLTQDNSGGIPRFKIPAEPGCRHVMAGDGRSELLREERF